MSERQKIRFDSKWIDFSDIIDRKTFAEVHAALDEIQQKYRSLVESDDLMQFDLRYSYDDTTLELDLFRWETDAEFEHRVKREEELARKKVEAARARKERAERKAAQAAAQTEDAERELYERLKQKFESA